MAQPVVDLEKMRQILLERRARLESQLRRMDLSIHGSQADEAGELSTYDDHQADLGTSTFERAKDLAVHDTIANLIKQVDAALNRIERGGYGICDMCGEPIAPARLEAIPYATLCIKCQRALEGS
jgi:RNA polymerase-binding protein DksA